MIQWIYTVQRDQFGIPPIEHWEICSDLQATIVKEEKVAHVYFSDKTGDVTDQIYYNLKIKDYFKALVLGGVSNYEITVPIEELDRLLHDVEAMDRSHFVAGHRY